MKSTRIYARLVGGGTAKGALAGAALLSIATVARADSFLPPWTDPGDVPLPTWARSVAPKRPETIVFTTPGRADVRRGTTLPNVRLPLYGTKRAPGCVGRWLLVGPLAWVCSDAADLSADEPFAPEKRRADDGLPFRYYFVGAGGAYAFLDVDRTDEDAPEQELEAGFGVAMAEEREVRGERWGRTRHGRWIAMRDLVAARVTAFHGLETGDTLDVAWVTSDAASVYTAPKAAGKPARVVPRFTRVTWREERPSAGPGGAVMVRISDDGASPEAWVRARDLAHPTQSAPPDEIGGAATTERWIDVELASQTLVAYDGTRPVYATLVSTGRGPTGSDTATPAGVHRIWVKLLTTNMDNLERDDAETHYSIEDVPYAQFFDKAVALHGAFWHQDFGRVHSHGCVNLAPRDAQYLFDFTGPHLPAPWSAALPTPLDRGTTIRVR